MFWYRPIEGTHAEWWRKWWTIGSWNGPLTLSVKQLHDSCSRTQAQFIVTCTSSWLRHVTAWGLDPDAPPLIIWRQSTRCGWQRWLHSVHAPMQRPVMHIKQWCVILQFKKSTKSRFKLSILQQSELLETYCGIFTPCKNCNFETRSHDYATIDEAVFSPCCAESHPKCFYAVLR
jgi:hypothetical protein